MSDTIEENNTEKQPENAINSESTTQLDKSTDNSENENEATAEIDTASEELQSEAIEETIDYSTLTKDELVQTFETLLKQTPVQNLKSHVEEIKSVFNDLFNEELEQQKKQFIDEGGNIIDFYYTTPLKKRFNALNFEYKEKRNAYYQSVKKDLQANLNKRLELIEELKGLLNAEENINTTYKHFKQIQEKWHVAGAIPRDKYNTIWNTYHHHVENFYDFLHLNREFRDLDFKHNLEQKLKLIGRAEELAQQENINKAFRELQMLHKMWKEELGPVAKEYRDEVWEKFSAATKIIHDKRVAYLKDLEKDFEKNYEAKKATIDAINNVLTNIKPSHQNWQNAIKKVQELRDSFFEIGKAPTQKNKKLWAAFKESTTAFNKAKNAFYKNQKKEQYDNLEKKLELIKIAEANKDNTDFDVVTPLMKKIQSDWKKIGHVPRKESDKIWKQFKDACNSYFDKVHAKKNEASKEQLENLKAKEDFLEKLKAYEIKESVEESLAEIKEKITHWKQLGRVPHDKKNIEAKFNSALDKIFASLKLNKQDAELIRFENKLNALVSQEDDKKLQNEVFFITKKIDETKTEIRQLENNLGFFQNVDENNPLVKEVHKNIKKYKDQLTVWQQKLAKIRAL